MIIRKFSEKRAAFAVQFRAWWIMRRVGLIALGIRLDIWLTVLIYRQIAYPLTMRVKKHAENLIEKGHVSYEPFMFEADQDSSDDLEEQGWHYR